MHLTILHTAMGYIELFNLGMVTDLRGGNSNKKPVELRLKLKYVGHKARVESLAKHIHTIWFDGISTIVGDVMSNTFFYVHIVLF